MIFFRFLIFLIALIPAHVFAFESGQTFNVKVKKDKVRIEVIDLAFDDEQQALVRAIALRLKDYSRTTNFEGCAVICEGFGKVSGLAAVMISAQSHIACPIVPACPAGYAPTPLHIHSHPARQITRLNTVDKVLTGADAAFGHDRNLNLPSRADYSLGKGFLVTQRSLIWFEGGSHKVVERWN
jgi:hypothetical protein